MRKRPPSPTVPTNPPPIIADSGAEACLAAAVLRHDLQKGKRQTVLTAPSEWDFRGVPPDELEACLCYELARETDTFAELAETYLGHVKTGSDAQIALYELLPLNRPCAYLLESLAPHFDLRKKTWEKMKPEIRKAAANTLRNRPAFGQAEPGEAGDYEFAMQGRFSNVHGLDERGEEIELKLARGVKEWDGVNLHFQSGNELTLVHIDWTQPVADIKRACKAWLSEKIERRGGLVKSGRHANPQSHAADMLRGLGAMRLLAHHPLKEAIKITKDKLDFSLYAGGFDTDERPTGQSAWDNGIERAGACFRETFPRETQGPRSWRLYQERRGK